MIRRNITILIIITLFLALFLFVLRHFMVNRIIEKNNREIENSVIELIKKEYRLDGGKPFIMYPHKLDSLGNYKLKEHEIEVIQKHIAKVLLKPYKAFNDSILKKTDFVPFVKYPQEKDSLGNYQLTPADLEMIKGYIKFLTDKVDEYIEATKAEIEHSIAKLNMWVSIWIGILGLFGALVPIFLNYSSTKDIDKKIGNTVELSQNAIKKAEISVKMVDGVNIKTDKINANLEDVVRRNADVSESLESTQKTLSSYETKYEKLHERIVIIEKESDETNKNLEESKESIEIAKERASASVEKSDKVEAILWQINSLSKIKSLDFHRLALFPEMPVETFLINRFDSIRSAFIKCNEIKLSVSDDVLFKDSLEEFVISFHQLPKYLDRRDVLDKVDEIKLCIAEFLDMEKYNEELYSKLDKLFIELNELLHI